MPSYVPFLYPISVFHEWWYLLIVPLSFGIAVVYRALKAPNLDRYWRSVAAMTLQIVIVLAGLAAGLVFWIQVVLPALPVQ